MLDKKIFTAIARGTAALGIGLMACNTAYAQESEEAVEAAPAADFWRLNVGVRAWSNDWTTWVDEQVTPNTVADAEPFGRTTSTRAGSTPSPRSASRSPSA